jgi:hypothetical protein
MPDTLQALGVLVIALLPGALYVWAFERQVGRWGIGLSDRALRFIGGSAMFHAAAAPLSYGLWADHWDAVRSARPVSWWLWLVPMLYVALPWAGGAFVGSRLRAGRPWTRWLTGPNAAPRAWDHLFAGEVDGWIRLRLKSGAWLGGVFAEANGRRSYAAGYPELQDLFLAAAVDTDPDTGEFVRDDAGLPTVQPGGLLIRWEEVEFLEFIDA